jgi:glyoxylase-like metal-dependent hydrolase (beta-lactamase superfamily II)
LLATHHHIDHVGLAGWLEERCGAALWMTEAELSAAREVFTGRRAWTKASRTRFLRQNGLDPARVRALAERHADLRRWMPRLPRRTRPLQDGKMVRLGGRDWQVLVSGGHSVALAALYSCELAVLIPGDQVLPHISPNVSVSPADPDGDPLGTFLVSLERLRLLPDRTLVLPAHGRPFLGLHARLEAMEEHHEQRLAAVYAACADGPVSGVDVAEALWPNELEGMRRLLALGESLAHLHHLRRRKLLRRRKGRDGVLRFRR